MTWIRKFSFVRFERNNDEIMTGFALDMMTKIIKNVQEC